MKQGLKKYFGILYIALITVAICAYLLLSGSLPAIVSALSTLQVRWIWAAGGCLAAYVLLRALTLHVYLRSQGARIRLSESLMISGIGQFYSAITPSASGGQPMQVYALSKLGVSVSTATAAVSIKFIGFQMASLLLCAGLWLRFLPLVSAQLGGLRFLVALGFFINLVLLGCILLVMTHRRMVRALAGWLLRLGVRLHLVRDAAALSARVERGLDDYQSSLTTLTRRPWLALGLFVLSLLQVICYLAILPCIYRAFGLHDLRAAEVLTLQTLLFIAAGFVPLPGAAGAQEGGFYLFFRGVFPEADMMAAVVCWRFFTYYLLLAVGLVAVVAEGVLQFVRARRD